MFVSRKKLKALVDENIALKKQNLELMDDNERLSGSNLDFPCGFSRQLLLE